MYTEKDKKDYATKITKVSRETGLPYEVCLAFGGDRVRLSLFKDILECSINNDLKDIEHSFLFNQFTEHIDIDEETGKNVNFEIPYYYQDEILSENIRRICRASKKLLRGITGGNTAYKELDLEALSTKAFSAIARHLLAVAEKKLMQVQLYECMSLLDETHLSEFKTGTFYVSKDAKQLQGMSVLKMLGITELVIQYGVTVIRPYAFENVPLKRVTFSRTVSHIRDGAFKGCSLSQVALPENKFLTEIGVDAFSHNPIEELELPKTILEFDGYSFRKTPLKRVFVHPGTKLRHVAKHTEVKEVEYE